MLKIVIDKSNFHNLSIDLLQYRRLLEPVLGDRKAMHLAVYNLPIAQYWQPIAFVLNEYQEPCELPDISEWSSMNLVLSEKAVSVLKSYLDACGELLPLASDGLTYYFFNCLKISELSEDSDVPPIYKSNHGGGWDLFCSDAFRRAVESAGLKGLKFTSDIAAF